MGIDAFVFMKYIVQRYLWNAETLDSKVNPNAMQLYNAGRLFQARVFARALMDVRTTSGVAWKALQYLPDFVNHPGR